MLPEWGTEIYASMRFTDGADAVMSPDQNGPRLEKSSLSFSIVTARDASADHPHRRLRVPPPYPLGRVAADVSSDVGELNDH